jgi:hypothetical protein
MSHSSSTTCTKSTNNTQIYVITTASSIDADENGFGRLIDSGAVGYFMSLEDARCAILENRCDIHEQTNRYAVIETVQEGLYGCDTESEWYEWSQEAQAYHEIPKPKALRHMCGFSFQ